MRLLLHSNTAVNVLVYAGRIKDFKEAIKRDISTVALCIKWCQRETGNHAQRAISSYGAPLTNCPAGNVFSAIEERSLSQGSAEDLRHQVDVFLGVLTPCSTLQSELSAYDEIARRGSEMNLLKVIGEVSVGDDYSPEDHGRDSPALVVSDSDGESAYDINEIRKSDLYLSNIRHTKNNKISKVQSPNRNFENESTSESTFSLHPHPTFYIENSSQPIRRHSDTKLLSKNRKLQ